MDTPCDAPDGGRIRRGKRGVKSYIRYNTRIGPWVLFACFIHADMTPQSSQEVIILGVTHDGKTFRPSDWAERLAGVMSQFRPGGALPGDRISYSPWCVPNTLDGQKCVIVHVDLREAEPLAWSFVMNFAKDNDLQVLEACMLPDAGATPAHASATPKTNPTT